MRRGGKSSLEGEQWIVEMRRRKSEEGENKNKRIVMIKLIIQE
jgi:hypothetical protein